jgi:hypothetical protein
MKRFWRIFWAGCWRTSLLWGLLTGPAASVWAKGEATKESSGPGTSGWVLPYIIVVLCIALGMLVVCKSSGRRERAKPEAYGESKESVAEEKKDKKK